MVHQRIAARSYRIIISTLKKMKKKKEMNKDKNKKDKKRINKMSDKQRKEFDALLIQYIAVMNKGLKSMVENNAKKNRLISITLLLFAITLIIISVNIFILQLR